MIRLDRCPFALIPLAALLGSGPASAEVVSGDTEVVAVIEEWVSGGVNARSALTVEDFDSLLAERAGGGRAIGLQPERLRGDAPDEESEEEREDERESELSSHFERSRIALLGDEPEVERQEPESPAREEESPEPAAPVAIPERPITVYDTPDPLIPQEQLQLLSSELRTLDPELRDIVLSPLQGPTASDRLEIGIQRLHVAQALGDEQGLSDAQHRLMADFEQQTLVNWVDRMLVVMEARRRGHEVTDIMIADALIPMIQARLSQITHELEQGGEVRLSQEEIGNLEATLGAVEMSPQVTAEPGIRRSLRGHVEGILEELGKDSDSFFQELEENLLAEKLIRDTVYEFYSEEDLRTFHRDNLPRFIQLPRYQYLGLKYIPPRNSTTGTVLDSVEMLDETRDAFRDAQRRMRRIDADVPLDDVRRQWGQIREDIDEFPPATYLTISHFQSLAEMPQALANALDRLEIGETSRLIELEHGFLIVRLVDVIPSVGDEFEEARPFVERVYFDEIRTQLVEALRESPRYHIFTNRHGMSLREVLERMDSPDAP
jgi:parvulin-like peptidyl-prolyl cis-trans isomerase-like protein